MYSIKRNVMNKKRKQDSDNITKFDENKVLEYKV